MISNLIFERHRVKNKSKLKIGLENNNSNVNSQCLSIFLTTVGCFFPSINEIIFIFYFQEPEYEDTLILRHDITHCHLR